MVVSPQTAHNRPVQTEILKELRDSDGPLQPKQLAELTDRSKDSIQSALRALKKRGEVEQPEYGLYTIPTHSGKDLEEVKSDIEDSVRVTLPLLSINAGASRKSDVWDVQIRSYMKVHRQTLQAETGSEPSRMAVVAVNGDSMYPTLSAGDKAVVVKHDDATIIEGVVYVWRSAHRGIIIKRAHWEDSKTLELVSDNDRYSPITIDVNNHEQWECVGRVIRVMRAV